MLLLRVCLVGVGLGAELEVGVCAALVGDVVLVLLLLLLLLTIEFASDALSLLALLLASTRMPLLLMVLLLMVVVVLLPLLLVVPLLVLLPPVWLSWAWWCESWPALVWLLAGCSVLGAAASCTIVILLAAVLIMESDVKSGASLAA